MFISTNILLTRLQFLYPDIVISSNSPLSLEPLKGIKQLPIKPEEIFTDYLYICDEYHPILSQDIPDKLKLVCVTDVSTDRANTNTVDTNIADTNRNNVPSFILLHTSVEMPSILNSLYDIYQRLRDWEQQLDIALIAGCELEHLLNISEPVLRFPLAIYDASLKVLAHSSGLDFNDTLFQTVIEKGYMPPEIVFMFERDNLFTELELHDIAYGKYLSAQGYSDIIIALKKNGYTAAYMAMPLVPTATEIYGGELLQLLGSKVTHFLEKEEESSLTRRYMHEYLISDLFENEHIDMNSLKERLEYIQVPLTGTFYLLQLKMTSKYKISTEHLLRYLESLLSEAIIFTLKKDIYILFHYSDSLGEADVQKHFSKSLNSIRKDLQQENILCGISLPFYNLLEVRGARTQAEAAVILYQRLQLSPVDELYCYYNSCSTSHLFLLAQEKAELKTFCHPGLLTMYEKDQQTDKTHFLILKTYLSSNCNFTDTAEHLHMHRNNVIYHLKRMENLYHFDLSNYKDRFRLELTIEILEYLNTAC